MSYTQQSPQFSPLLYYLQNSKIPDLIRVMFNCNLSEQYLSRYGKEPDQTLTPKQWAKITEFVKFSQKQLVYLKGSNPNRIVDHTNTFLKSCLKEKLTKKHTFSQQSRKEVWKQLTDCYRLPTLFKQINSFEIPEVLRQSIRKDVTRTQLSHDILQGASQEQKHKKNGTMQIHITNVLQRFAIYNPYIGYCQGMNNLVLYFYEQGFDDQSSFFLLKKITQQILPCDYYTTMNSVQAFVRLLCQILTITHPKVVSVMRRVARNNGGDGIVLITGFTIQWFVCLFSNTNLNRDMRRCIFDHLLLSGLPVLIKASLCYFDAIQPEIVDVDHLQEYHPIVQKTIREYSNIEHLYKCLTQIYISQHLLRLTLEKLSTHTEKSSKSYSKHQCNREWTTCLQTVQNHLSQGYTHDFFVFKTASEPKIIHNYLQKRQQKGYFNIKNQRKADLIKLGRIEHTCRPTSTTSQTQSQSLIPQANGSISSACKSQLSPQSKLSDFSKHFQIYEPQRKELIRNRALQKLQSQNKSGKSVLHHSQSVKFLKQMIKNESFNNLMQILEVQQMGNLFRQCIAEDDN